MTLSHAARLPLAWIKLPADLWLTANEHDARLIRCCALALFRKPKRGIRLSMLRGAVRIQREQNWRCISGLIGLEFFRVRRHFLVRNRDVSNVLAHGLCCGLAVTAL